MTTRTSGSPYACGWSLDDTCCSKLAEAFADEATEELAQACVDQAAEILYALSGRQFGLCEVKVRPCREECTDWRVGPFSFFPWYPALENGIWRNVACGGGCKGACSCSRVCEVALPGPVGEVTEVLLDGEILDEEAYRVDNRRSLVRIDGGCWPTCQEMGLPSTEMGTWEVTYLRGLEVPAAGQAALGALACELCKACIGDSSCCLPARVTEITRQGIKMAMLDPMDFLDQGRTGIYAVDLWLRAVNPLGRSRRAHVFSVDAEPARHQTWPGPS